MNEENSRPNKGNFRGGSKVQGPMNSSNLIGQKLKLVPRPLDKDPRHMGPLFQHVPQPQPLRTS
jgi:hypothetical protein